jgi:ferric-dicitrate binding protein FerR (iron transport regulator)
MSDVRQGDGLGSDAVDPVEARVVAPLRRARVEPDDLQLARLCAALDAAVRDVEVPTKARERDRRRARWTGSAALALALGVAVSIVVPSLRHAPTPTAQAPARQALSIAREGGTAAAAPASLVVPAGVRQRGRIGERVRFTLVGPGEISAFTVAGGSEVDVASGRLLVDYDGYGGETLRVRSPGAVTTVVGTLFAVEALGRTSRVAVARGSVTVEGAGARLQQVAAGRSWLTEAPNSEPIPSDLAADLAAQDIAGAAGGGEPRDHANEAAPPQPSDVPAPGAGHDRARGGGADVRARRPSRPPIGKSDAEAAYAAAEELMRAGSTMAARSALLDFVTTYPADPRAELALLDLARLALAAGHPIEARGYVARLLAATKDDALIDLAHQIERRIEAAAVPARHSGR